MKKKTKQSCRAGKKDYKEKQNNNKNNNKSNNNFLETGYTGQ